jgi:hypothetical protein
MIKENQKDFPECKNLIPVSSSFSILSNGKVSKKRLLDALACLEADLKFLQEEIKKSDGFLNVGNQKISSIKKGDLSA